MLYKDIINPFIIPNRTLQYSTHFYDFQFGGYFAYYQAREEGSEYVNMRVDCEALLSMTRELRVWLKVLVDSIKYYCPLAEERNGKASDDIGADISRDVRRHLLFTFSLEI